MDCACRCGVIALSARVPLLFRVMMQLRRAEKFVTFFIGYLRLDAELFGWLLRYYSWIDAALFGSVAELARKKAKRDYEVTPTSCS